MTTKEVASCILTVKLLRTLAHNIHGFMVAIDEQNCEKIIKLLEEQEEQPKELVRCKDCRKRGTIMCHLWFNSPIPKDSWYCADGERK